MPGLGFSWGAFFVYLGALTFMVLGGFYGYGGKPSSGVPCADPVRAVLSLPVLVSCGGRRYYAMYAAATRT